MAEAVNKEHKAGTFGQRLESQTALVLCDDCVDFFTFHIRATVSVQGNKVGSGGHQSVKVGRTTV